MNGRILKITRWTFVSVGVIALSSFSLDAALSPQGISQSALGILASKVGPEKKCPNGTTPIVVSGGTVCADQFEVSPGGGCPHPHVQNTLETRINNEQPNCLPQSEAGRFPWTFVTFHQAKELCAKVGKRLPNNDEWYEMMLGTPDGGGDMCNVNGEAPGETGHHKECRTPRFVYDGIGNVWEWIDADVKDGMYNNRKIPESGYVVAADTSGVAEMTNSVKDGSSFHDDYFWSERAGEFGMIRGGYFGSENDAGLYSIQAKTARSFSGNAIGFRCVQGL